jgi:DNA-binding GntR family transcriptional regulator
VSQHEAIIAASEEGDARGAADAVRENWLSLGALIEKTFRSEET